ncbi:hypothetical protein P2T68_02825 [Pseudomonas sp. G11]|uniref:Uncharacterized protein n=1 Tax=Pseudomonas trivialis TaxID=200450 RepID=A0A0H5A7B9_9PSED|nr:MULTISPECIES: hypothetical protein [Pseudomonas]AKS06934.1 hypothetical protein AA957_12690 [Pseudomonas trivialis]WEX16280.1 hypothetical protein P2T68_02825 [Pseudomonas sp. G11]
MADIKVTTRKSFRGIEGYVKKNTTIEVDEFRARELLRSGLIEDYEMKSAEKPENKQAPTPSNKAAPKPAAKKKAD